MSDKCEKCGQATNYQGWQNYETWGLKLQIDNDYGLYLVWQESAKLARRSAPKCEQVTSGVWTVEQAARFGLADDLKAYFEEAAEELDLQGVFSDLLTAALGRVDWNAIAEALLEDIEEEEGDDEGEEEDA